MCVLSKARLTGGTLTLPEEKQPLSEKKSSRTRSSWPSPTGWQWSTTIGVVHFWVLPYEFSQSRLADRNRTSNACTFIALMLAKYLYHTSCHLTPARALRKGQTLTMMREVLHILGNSIVEGNDGHSEAMRNRHRRKRQADGIVKSNLFTIPQAIAEVGGIHEVDFRVVRDGKKNLAKYLRAAVESNLLTAFSQIFILLIMVERAVLVTFDRDEETIAVIDGHAHQSSGAVIIASPVDQLDLFCGVILTKLFPDLPPAQSFEISVVQIVSDPPPRGIVSDVKPRPAPLEPVTGNHRIFPQTKANISVISETETNYDTCK